jgi:hypothetical protein
LWFKLLSVICAVESIMLNSSEHHELMLICFATPLLVGYSLSSKPLRLAVKSRSQDSPAVCRGILSRIILTFTPRSTALKRAFMIVFFSSSVCRPKNSLLASLIIQTQAVSIVQEVFCPGLVVISETP